MTFKYPNFVTQLMEKWFTQFESERMEEITCIGLFKWQTYQLTRSGIPFKKKRVKMLRSVSLRKKTSYIREFRFLQLNEKTLQVHSRFGLPKAGYSKIYEYFFDGDVFQKGECLLYRIS